jgi:hypothetical protein
MLNRAIKLVVSANGVLFCRGVLGTGLVMLVLSSGMNAEARFG